MAHVYLESGIFRAGRYARVMCVLTKIPAYWKEYSEIWTLFIPLTLKERVINDEGVFKNMLYNYSPLSRELAYQLLTNLIEIC